MKIILKPKKSQWTSKKQLPSTIWFLFAFLIKSFIFNCFCCEKKVVDGLFHIIICCCVLWRVEFCRRCSFELSSGNCDQTTRKQHSESILSLIFPPVLLSHLCTKWPWQRQNVLKSSRTKRQTNRTAVVVNRNNYQIFTLQNSALWPLFWQRSHFTHFTVV